MSDVKRECRVIMLASNKKADLQSNIIHKILRYKDVEMAEIPSQPYQHLYIISDNEIRESDWFINLSTNEIYQAGEYANICHNKLKDNHCKKIIATTDQSLKIHKFQAGVFKNLEYSLPQPSQQFIEKYVEEYNKGNVIDRVMVEYVENGDIDFGYGLPEPIVKVHPNDNAITISKIKDTWNRDELRKEFMSHDVNFIMWIRNRMENIHNENPNYDYMIKLKSIADWIKENL